MTSEVLSAATISAHASNSREAAVDQLQFYPARPSDDCLDQLPWVLYFAERRRRAENLIALRGCCGFPDAQQPWESIATCQGRVVEVLSGVKCAVTHRPCPMGDIQDIAKLFSILNGD